MFVKPANLGSSVGISKVKTADELDAALDLAASFDRKLIIEAGVPDAREIECAVLGNDAPEVSVPGEVVPANEFYDYDAKYISGGSKTVIPAKLTEKVAAEVRRMAVAAFEAIDGSGLARVDFLANASHELRTPIAAMRTFVELLQGPAGVDPAARAEFDDAGCCM